MQTELSKFKGNTGKVSIRITRGHLYHHECNGEQHIRFFPAWNCVLRCTKTRSVLFLFSVLAGQRTQSWGLSEHIHSLVSVVSLVSLPGCQTEFSSLFVKKGKDRSIADSFLDLGFFDSGQLVHFELQGWPTITSGLEQQKLPGSVCPQNSAEHLPWFPSLLCWLSKMSSGRDGARHSLSTKGLWRRVPSEPAFVQFSLPRRVFYEQSRFARANQSSFYIAARRLYDCRGDKNNFTKRAWSWGAGFTLTAVVSLLRRSPGTKCPLAGCWHSRQGCWN